MYKSKIIYGIFTQYINESGKNSTGVAFKYRFRNVKKSKKNVNCIISYNTAQFRPKEREKSVFDPKEKKELDKIFF